MILLLSNANLEKLLVMYFNMIKDKIFEIFETLSYALDFFKSPFNFYFSKDKKLISSKFGSLISSLILIYLINEIFNSNMYQKTNPSIITQKSFDTIRPNIQLNSQNFELAIGLYDENLTNYFIDSSLYNVQIIQGSRTFLWNKTISQVQNVIWNKTNFNYHICNQNDFNLTGEKISYPNPLCLDNLNFQLEGYVNEIILSYFEIDFSFCNNETSNVTCKSQQYMENELKGKIFGVYFSDYNINYQIFLQPIITTPETVYLWTDSTYFKTLNVFLKKFEFYDDFSYFVSNPQKLEGFSLDTVTSDFVLRENDDPIAKICFFSSQELDQNTRRYQKLTELFANIGGAASLLITIGFIFVNFFTNWTLRVNFFDNLYELQVTNKEKSVRGVEIDKLIPLKNFGAKINKIDNNKKIM